MSKFKKELIELLLLIDRNENAYDDDLQETWDNVAVQIYKVDLLMKKFIKEE